MKQYSRSELQELGKSIAEANKVDSLYATSDGQFFLPSKGNAANLHKTSNKLELYELDYSAKMEKIENPEITGSALDTTEVIPTITGHVEEKSEVLTPEFRDTKAPAKKGK